MKTVIKVVPRGIDACVLAIELKKKLISHDCVLQTKICRNYFDDSL